VIHDVSNGFETHLTTWNLASFGKASLQYHECGNTFDIRDTSARIRFVAFRTVSYERPQNIALTSYQAIIVALDDLKNESI